MDIPINIFDVKKASPHKPYEVNLGFIWKTLKEKSKQSEIFQSVLLDFEQKLRYEKSIYDKSQSPTFDFTTKEEYDKFKKSIKEHPNFTSHYLDVVNEIDTRVILRCYEDDIYINVLDYITADKNHNETFALQLNLLDIQAVPLFLDYQYDKVFGKNKKKFARYLEGIIIDFENFYWFSEKHSKRLKIYLLSDLNSKINQYAITEQRNIDNEEENTFLSLESHIEVGEDIVRRHEELEKIEELFLNGRNIFDLAKEEFDELQKLTNNSYLSPFDPVQSQIITNREIYQEWSKYIAIQNNRQNIRSDVDKRLGINLRSILMGLGNIQTIVQEYLANNKFICDIISDLAFVHDLRKVHINPHHAKAIAAPNFYTITDKELFYRGIINYGVFCYNLLMDLTLDKREYNSIHLKRPFCLFFALKLSQVDLMEINDFLDYQLKETFEENFIEFKSFLNPLLIRYRFNDFEGFKKEILNVEIVNIARDWLANQEHYYIFSNNSEKIEGQTRVLPLPLPENWTAIPIKEKYEHRNLLDFFSFLYKETGGDPKHDTYMLKKDVEELFQYGLAYPNVEGHEKFVLNSSKSYRSEAVFFYCLSIFRANFLDYHGNKKDLVTFLIRNFQNFKDENHSTFERNFRSNKPKTFKFKNFERQYLPLNNDKNK